jgi:DNA-binding MarR family transcriptional regulator
MTGANGAIESNDAVDDIQTAWRRLHPDLDVDVIGIVGRVLRSAALIVRRSDEVLGEYGLGRGEFDILAALRRSSAPQSPGSLRTISLATAPATTKRLKALEARGFVVRSANPTDGRGALIALTAEGQLLVDRIFPAQLKAEQSLVAALSAEEARGLESGLRRLLASIDRA